MFTFLFGILILILGYIFYSKIVVKNFAPTNAETPAHKNYDGVDFVPMSKWRNMLIQLLNIAGIGPILGAIQGILFGPIAFILIPTGCILMGAVHDYATGMLSIRENGAQITGLIEKYLGKAANKFFLLLVVIMLVMVSSVFLYSSGDIIAAECFKVRDFSLTNPIMVVLYSAVLLYFIVATLFPIDKIIGKFYPYFGALLILGTGLILLGFITHGITLEEIDFHNLNKHPQKLALIPIFFMTVSCGLLSGFHSTQSTIISRAVNKESDAKEVFYGMMCLESLIAMVWAAGAMHVYANGLVPADMIGKVNVVNIVTNNFVPAMLTWIIAFAVVVLPITSGDTALRGARIIIAETFKINQKSVRNRVLTASVLVTLVVAVLIYAKLDNEKFFLVWRYFTFCNQLISIPVLLVASIYLYKTKKNFLITFIPSVFMSFMVASFILNAKFGFNLNLNLSYTIAGIICLAIACVFYVKMKKLSRN